MAHQTRFDVERVNVSVEIARRMRAMMADKGDVLHTLCSASVTVEDPGETSSGHAPPQAVQEPMHHGTSTHIITTQLYVDSGGHVHVVTFDEHTATSGTILEILSDVPIT